MKTIRNVRVHDAAVGSVATKDDLLEAVDPGKVLALGEVWDGIGQRLDALVEAIKPLRTGFTSGNVLHAQRAATVVDLGTVWNGLNAIGNAIGMAIGLADLPTTDGNRQATATANLIGKMNSDAKAMWAGKKDAPAQARAPQSIDDINQSNRAFWAKRA